jgi:hypothetical protein
MRGSGPSSPPCPPSTDTPTRSGVGVYALVPRAAAVSNVAGDPGVCRAVLALAGEPGATAGPAAAVIGVVRPMVEPGLDGFLHTEGQLHELKYVYICSALQVGRHGTCVDLIRRYRVCTQGCKQTCALATHSMPSAVGTSSSLSS